MSVFVTYLFNRKRLFYFLFIGHFFFPSALVSASVQNHKEINIMIDRCIRDQANCKDALVRIHFYQVQASNDENFPCQTRLLGLEANIIMAMNDNLKRKKIIYIVIKNQMILIMYL